MKIKTKRQFLDLYIAGVLGNRFQVWENYEDCLADGCFDVGFREVNIAGGGQFFMVHGPLNIIHYAKKWKQEGRKFYLNAGDYEIQKKATIQGEICYLIDGWHAYIGPASEFKMRDMFKYNLAKVYRGVAVRYLMKYYMDPNTLDDIDELLELYPEAVIEFTSYSVDVGILPNRNTIIWEVRNY